MEKTILNADHIRRAIMRISYQVVELHRDIDQLVLAGILTRGAPLARRISDHIGEIKGTNIPVIELDTRPYRDDITGVERGQFISHPSIPINDTKIVLIDDVLYTGRTARAALDALIDIGRPLSIHLGVLVDRGHRQLPIRADFVGKNIPTAHSEAIQVRLEETDLKDEVVLVGANMQTTHTVGDVA